MNKNNSTTYSIVGSLGVHLLFTLGAGNFLMNINNSVQPQKTYQMEFVKRKAPPLVRKEMIRKKQIRKEIKVVSLTPKAMPVLQPKKAIRQTRKVRTIVKMATSTPKKVQKVTLTKSAMIRNTPTINRKINTPVPRAFTTPASKRSTRVAMVQGTQHFKLSNLPKPVVNSSSSVSSSKRSTRVAMVQGTQHFKLSKLPKPVVNSSSSSSSNTDNDHVKMVQTGVKMASLTFASPQSVTNFDDSGARTSYGKEIRRRVQKAKDKEYPSFSRKTGRQGVIKVQFTILKNGQLGNVSLLTETTYPELNRAAMAAVKRAAPFANIPDSIMDQSLNFVLPIRFEIK